MSGILGTAAGTQADINLLLHVLILALIVTGFTFARRKKFTIHEKWMFTGIALVAVSFFAWMAPSYLRNFIETNAFSNLSSLGVLITNTHVVLGSITGILAIYIVLRMKFDLPPRFTVKRVRRLMRTTFTLWWLTFIFGLSYYIWFYVIQGA